MSTSTQPHPHVGFLQEVQEEFDDILAGSDQGIYIYLDDPHWICNERLATLLGWSSPQEVVSLTTTEPILDALVAPESRNTVVHAYADAVEHKRASMVNVTYKKRDGGHLKTHTIFVPISFKGTMLALHFITPA